MLVVDQQKENKLTGAFALALKCNQFTLNCALKLIKMLRLKKGISEKLLFEDFCFNKEKMFVTRNSRFTRKLSRKTETAAGKFHPQKVLSQ